jgi:hypothetical protein
MNKITYNEVYDSWRGTKYQDDKRYLFGFFASYLGLYPAVLFIRYGVQANTVTVLSLFPLFVGLYAISVNFISIGILLVFLWFLLDSTDGHIARFCCSVSKSGHFLDSLGAFFVYGFFFICASMSLNNYLYDGYVFKEGGCWGRGVTY